MIATFLTTLCREVLSPLPAFRFSRQFSRQSVVSGKPQLGVILPKWQDRYPDILSGWAESDDHKMVPRWSKASVAKSEIPTQIPTNCRDSTKTAERESRSRHSVES